MIHCNNIMKGYTIYNNKNFSTTRYTIKSKKFAIKKD